MLVTTTSPSFSSNSKRTARLSIFEKIAKKKAPADTAYRQEKVAEIIANIRADIEKFDIEYAAQQAKLNEEKAMLYKQIDDLEKRHAQR